jgi:hypothetical protein
MRRPAASPAGAAGDAGDSGTGRLTGTGSPAAATKWRKLLTESRDRSITVGEALFAVGRLLPTVRDGTRQIGPGLAIDAGAFL